MLHTRIPAFLTPVLLLGVCFAQSKEKKMEEQQQQQPASASEPQKGRILGIGGIFFKSESRNIRARCGSGTRRTSVSLIRVKG